MGPVDANWSPDAWLSISAFKMNTGIDTSKPDPTTGRFISGELGGEGPLIVGRGLGDEMHRSVWSLFGYVQGQTKVTSGSPVHAAMGAEGWLWNSWLDHLKADTATAAASSPVGEWKTYFPTAITGKTYELLRYPPEQSGDWRCTGNALFLKELIPWMGVTLESRKMGKLHALPTVQWPNGPDVYPSPIQNTSWDVFCTVYKNTTSQNTIKLWDIIGYPQHGFLHNPNDSPNGFSLKFDFYMNDLDDTQVTWEDENLTLDYDGDGFSVPDDCNDFDPLIYPGAPRRKNTMDNDCNGYIDLDEVKEETGGADARRLSTAADRTDYEVYRH